MPRSDIVTSSKFVHRSIIFYSKRNDQFTECHNKRILINLAVRRNFMQKQVEIYGSPPFPHLLSRLFSDCQSLLFMRHIALMSVLKEALRARLGLRDPQSLAMQMGYSCDSNIEISHCMVCCLNSYKVGDLNSNCHIIIRLLYYQ